MNIILEKSNLLDGLKKIGVYVDNKSHQLYASVKIETIGNDTIELSVTNGNDYITTEIPAQVVASGSVVLTHKQVNDFLKKSKAVRIEIETLDDNKVNVKANNIDYKVASHDISNYPIAPEISDENMLSLEIDEYKRLIKNTTYACSTSDSRPILKGVNVKAEYGKLHFIATDSHRLGRYTIDTILENINVIPDGLSLEKSLKVIDKNTKNISLSFNENHTVLKFDDTKIYIKNIEGNYPDTSRLIPDDFRTYTTIETAETLESLEMLNTVSKNDRNNVVSMYMNGKIELTANDHESGEMSALLSGQKQGEDLKISYNNVYMKEALKALNEKEVQLNFCGAMRPFTVSAADNKALHLILPVRTI